VESNPGGGMARSSRTLRGMNFTLKGTVRYLGTHFSGWQAQERQRTVQGEIESALSRIASRPVRIQGAGRTDAGVHALGQVFSCPWPRPLNATLRHALCRMLEPEIEITDLVTVADTFNARFSALSKRYCYSFHFSREMDPFCAPYCWQVPYVVDVGLMASLLPRLEGEHDFAGFQSTGSQMTTTVRTIYEAKLERGAVIGPADGRNLWHLELYGDGFLYHMVRNIAGTLVEIGRGRFTPDFIDQALASGGPFLGHCAPAQGLVLKRVYYPEEYGG
jgi:tRNA pseudouridine38-40 synthase